MRSQNNLKKFGHAAKTKQEASYYTDQVSGGTTKDLTGNQDDFDETLSKDQPSGNPEKINSKKPPYISWSTWFSENGRNILVCVIAIPILGWFSYTFIDYGRNLSTLNANYDNLKDEVGTMKNKYDVINEKTIKSDVLLEEIQKDIERLNQRINTKAN